MVKKTKIYQTDSLESLVDDTDRFYEFKTSPERKKKKI